MSDYERGFLEGLIDGEGSLFFYVTNGCKYARMTIGNTDRALLEKAQAIAGGRLYGGKIRSHPDGHIRKPMFYLHFGETALKDLLPHLRLVTKEEQRIKVLEKVREKNDKYKRRLHSSTPESSG